MSIAGQFGAGVLVSIAAMLGACNQASASQAPFGIYAYDPSAWNAEAAKHFPIVVVQYRSWQKSSRDIQNIKALAASGSRVIIDFEFWATQRQRQGHESRRVGDVVVAATSLLDQLKGVPIEAISLDEENRPTPDRLALLNTLYGQIKAKYPDRRIVQWISATINLPQLSILDLKKVGADGWIIDPYTLPATDYQEYVRVMKGVNPTIYSVVWAAPGWQVAGGFRKIASPSWWNDASWRTFYNRVAVNQANDIPTIFYLFGLDQGWPKMLWGGGSCDRSFYASLVTDTLPYLQKHQLALTAPAERPSWVPRYCGK